MPKTRMDDLAKQLNSEEGFNLEGTTSTLEQEKHEPSNDTPKKKRTFQQTDTIMCRSVVIGGLFLEGTKTKMLYEWRGYGDEVAVEYRDLVSEVRARSSFVYTPWAIIEDEDFLDEFPQVRQFYIDSHSVVELRDILSHPLSKMIKEISELPSGAKDVLKNIAAEAVARGELDSVSKIKALDDIYGTDLNLLASLSE